MTAPVKPSTIVIQVPTAGPADGALRCIGGSRLDDWNNTIVNDTVSALWLKGAGSAARDRMAGAAVAGLIGVAPADEVEGMIAAQLVAAHSAAMECYRRAMLPDQTFEGRRENLRQATRLSGAFAELLSTLDRRRGKGGQKIVVKHVHVAAGGQAIVGAVTTGATTPGVGGAQKFEDQPHAPAG